MCGIAGVAGNAADLTTEHSSNPLTSLTNALRHRGPNGGGFFTQSKNTARLVVNERLVFSESRSSKMDIGLGHRRLSIIDRSEQGFQPFVNEDRSTVLIANGEVYNYKTLRSELISEGVHFQSQSDCEVILRLYDRYGVESFNRLRGMYAFAIWDSKQNRLVLHRDRFGEKPLYYWVNAGTLYFASELKSLQTLPGFPTEVSSQAVESYFLYGHVMPPWSWFKGVSKVACGHAVLWDGETVKSFLAWKPEYPKRTRRRFDRILSEFDQRFDDVIRESSIADDIECALPLSGGIDSSLLALAMTEAGRKFNKFTIVDSRTENLRDECERAKAIASITPGEHILLELGESSEDLIDLVSWCDEPVGSLVDLGLRNTLYSRIAPQTPVAMIGGSADFIFYNGNRFHTAMQRDHLSDCFGPLKSWLPGSLGFNAGRFVRQRHESLRRMANPIFKSSGKSTDVVDEFVRTIELFRPPSHVWTTLFMTFTMERQYIQYLDDLFGMRYALEVRDPFLDWQLSEFVGTIPYDELWPGLRESRYDGRSPHTKKLLRQSLDRKSGGRIASVVAGKKMGWGAEKGGLALEACYLSGPGKPYDISKNHFLGDCCGLNMDVASRALSSDQDTPIHPVIKQRLIALNLWTSLHNNADRLHVSVKHHPALRL